MKRLMDITLALALLAALAPASLVVMIVLWRTARQVIFRQRRIGLHGREFTIYKFVTMRSNAGRDIVTDNADPRITRVGRFLRATALDETPELINVLKGDMSIVGPRPAQVWEHEQCALSISGWRCRTNVRPGLIGLAQLRAHRSDNEAKLAHDIEYIDARSLWLDLKIIAKGIVYNLKGRWV